MSFRIFFRGLVSHVQVDAKPESRAVMVAAHKHEPTLIVPKAAFDSETTGKVPPVKVAGNGDRLYDISGWNVEVQGVGNVPTKRLTSFDEHVPSLPVCLVDNVSSKKKVKADVHAKKHIAGATFSYIDYKDGTIETVDCYTQAVEFDKPQDEDPECVAEVTMYNVELAGKVTLVVSDGTVTGSIMLNANSSITASNRAGKGNHFKEYKKITDASDIRIPKAKDNRICVDCVPRDDEDHEHGHDEHSGGNNAEHSIKPHPELLAAGTVECTQTRYP